MLREGLWEVELDEELQEQSVAVQGVEGQLEVVKQWWEEGEEVALEGEVWKSWPILMKK